VPFAYPLAAANKVPMSKLLNPIRLSEGYS